MLVAVWGGLASIAGSAARAGGRILSISVTSPVPASHSRSKYKVVRMWPTGAETSTRRRRRGWQGWPASREPRWLFFFWCYAGGEQCEGEGAFCPSDIQWRWREVKRRVICKAGGAESNCHLVTDYLTAMPANVIVVDTHDPNWLLICTLTNIALPSSYNIGRALLILCQLLLRTLRVKCPLCLSLQSKFIDKWFFLPGI